MCANKENISGHRFEGINMAAKCKIFMNFNNKLIDISKKKNKI